MRGLRSFVAIAALVLSAAPAAADVEDESALAPSNLEAGLFAGLFISNYYHQFFSDENVMSRQELEDSQEFGFRFAWFPHDYVGGEVESAVIFLDTLETQDPARIFGLRGQVVAQYPARLSPFVAAGVGLSHIRSANKDLGSDTDFPVHVGAGARLFIYDKIALRLDLRLLRGPSSKEPYTLDASYGELMFGVSFVPKHRPRSAQVSAVAPDRDADPDQDGVKGSSDLCPERAGEPPNGCPSSDPDGDGITETDDRCPDRAETFNGVDDLDGCPDVKFDKGASGDSDGDKVPDAADKCKFRAEDADGFEDADGCPDPDNDGDKVLDAADQCPDQAGTSDAKGCPVK